MWCEVGGAFSKLIYPAYTNPNPVILVQQKKRMRLFIITGALTYEYSLDGGRERRGGEKKSVGGGGGGRGRERRAGAVGRLEEERRGRGRRGVALGAAGEDGPRGKQETGRPEARFLGRPWQPEACEECEEVMMGDEDEDEDEEEIVETGKYVDKHYETGGNDEGDDEDDEDDFRTMRSGCPPTRAASHLRQEKGQYAETKNTGRGTTMIDLTSSISAVKNCAREKSAQKNTNSGRSKDSSTSKRKSSATALPGQDAWQTWTGAHVSKSTFSCGRCSTSSTWPPAAACQKRRRRFVTRGVNSGLTPMRRNFGRPKKLGGETAERTAKQPRKPKRGIH